MTDYLYVNSDYEDLAWFYTKKAALDDEAIAFDSDLAYLRDLLQALAEGLDSQGGTALPFPSDDRLDIIQTELSRIEVK